MYIHVNLLTPPPPKKKKKNWRFQLENLQLKSPIFFWGGGGGCQKIYMYIHRLIHIIKPTGMKIKKNPFQMENFLGHRQFNILVKY